MDNAFLLMLGFIFYLEWPKRIGFITMETGSLGMLLFLVRDKLLFVIFETWKPPY